MTPDETLRARAEEVYDSLGAHTVSHVPGREHDIDRILAFAREQRAEQAEEDAKLCDMVGLLNFCDSEAEGEWDDWDCSGGDIDRQHRSDRTQAAWILADRIRAAAERDKVKP